MKKKLTATCILILFLVIGNACFAQKKPSYVPDKGYWQLVTNIHDRKTTTVQFYNDDHLKIYEETVTGTRLNAKRKKVRRQLYMALEEAYKQWAAHVQISSNDLIAKRK